jgi:nucleoside-diphosphate-sugar epimerase
MWSEEKLDDLLSEPTPALIEDIRKIPGTILVAGAAGKMGPSLCILIKRAVEKAGIEKQVIAVSRFSDQAARTFLERRGIECIPGDFLDDSSVKSLPEAENVIFMAGRKFGTQGAEADTWAMNTLAPARIAERYRNARVVVFSSGNLYPMVGLLGGGTDETIPPQPLGEYAMSCLGRERIFDYFARRYGLRSLFFRLNYAIALRYGVLHDIAIDILKGCPISLATPAFNCIWQRDANEIAVRGLLYTGNPPVILNVTGPETVPLKMAALKLGEFLGREPVFTGQPEEKALLSNAGKAHALFGYPTVALDTMIRWQAEWLLQNGSSLGKPTHFEEREGKF